ILRAEGKLDQAKSSFERAMALDSALGDAWAGRGLCLIRQGQLKAGRHDLFTAAALEPNRAIFRKYLNQAMGDSEHPAATAKGASPHSTVTDPSKPSSSKPVSTAGNPPNPPNSEPVYQGRIPGAGTNVNPPGYPIIVPPVGVNPNPNTSSSGP